MDEYKDLFFETELDQEPHLLPPLVLAYVGDAVFELYIRLKLVGKTSKMQELHQQAVSYVKAEAQSDILSQWEEVLTEDEQSLLRRGRNAKGNVPRNTEVITYRRSTGFETLIGYLYLARKTDRLQELLSMISI